MKIVVTGAYGQLGKEICRQIGPNAVGVDLDTLDLTKLDAIGPKLRELRPDVVVNCAAYTAVDKAETETEFARTINALAAERIAQTVAEWDGAVLQVSTDYVFCGNGLQTKPFTEIDAPKPQGVYAVTKHEAETLVSRYPKHWITRTCGLYARRSDEAAKNFVKTMLRVGAANKELKIVDDQHCTPTSVPQLARAILHIVGFGGGRPAPFGLYHVTQTGETTWRGFAEEIFRLARLDVKIQPITTAEYGAPSPRPAYSVLDTSKYHALGGPKMTTWQEALAEYFAE